MLSCKKKNQIKMAVLWLLILVLTTSCGWSDRIEENKADKKWPRSYALSMVENKYGSCYAYASLYGFLAKKVTGYPVRVGAGKTRGFGEDLQTHAWTEIKMDGVWYICDTNLDKYAAEGAMVYFLKKRSSKAMKSLYDNYKDVEYAWVQF